MPGARRRAQTGMGGCERKGRDSLATSQKIDLGEGHRTATGQTMAKIAGGRTCRVNTPPALSPLRSRPLRCAGGQLKGAVGREADTFAASSAHCCLRPLWATSGSGGVTAGASSAMGDTVDLLDHATEGARPPFPRPSLCRRGGLQAGFSMFCGVSAGRSYRFLDPPWRATRASPTYPTSSPVFGLVPFSPRRLCRCSRRVP
jgi:hypothetical protein